MNEELISYQVDKSDMIINVSGNWKAFALENVWEAGSSSEHIVGVSLWDFVDGFDTRHLYQELFRRVRSGTVCKPIPFRCDSPDERRFLELRVIALNDGDIEVRSTRLRTEPRPHVNLIDPEVDRTPGQLKICSMCKKIEVTPGTWAEIEDGVIQLRTFEEETVPQLTHGLCSTCLNQALASARG